MIVKSASRAATVLLTILYGATTVAQMDTMSLGFSTLTINDGLSRGLVHAIAQDGDGFMWFGAKDGLNRFDGCTFNVFRHNPEDSTTISQSMVTSLCVDGYGRLWVGTSDYDLVLMDLQMPEMNGYEATRAIRSMADDKARIPIVAMTANVMQDELELCRQAGMNGHIPKPFTREELTTGTTQVIP